MPSQTDKNENDVYTQDVFILPETLETIFILRENGFILLAFEVSITFLYFKWHVVLYHMTWKSGFWLELLFNRNSISWKCKTTVYIPCYCSTIVKKTKPCNANCFMFLECKVSIIPVDGNILYMKTPSMFTQKSCLVYSQNLKLYTL